MGIQARESLATETVDGVANSLSLSKDFDTGRAVTARAEFLRRQTVAIQAQATAAQAQATAAQQSADHLKRNTQYMLGMLLATLVMAGAAIVSLFLAATIG